MSRKKITSGSGNTLYEITCDHILGAEQVADGEARPDQLKRLKGKVTEQELIAAGCDVDWLAKSGSIVKLGYAVE